MPTTNSGHTTYHSATSENGLRRLSMLMETGVVLALTRLAKLHGLSDKEMLARLVTQADDSILATLNPRLPEWDTYFDLKPVKL